MVFSASSLLILPSRTLAIKESRSAGRLSAKPVSFFVMIISSSVLFSFGGEEQASAKAAMMIKYFFMRMIKIVQGKLAFNCILLARVKFPGAHLSAAWLQFGPASKAHYVVMCRLSGLPGEACIS